MIDQIERVNSQPKVSPRKAGVEVDFSGQNFGGPTRQVQPPQERNLDSSFDAGASGGAGGGAPQPYSNKYQPY